MLQDIDDEPLLDGLLHGVGVKGHMPGNSACGSRPAEYLQSLVLRSRGEGEVAGIGQEPLGLHQPIDLVLGGLCLLLSACLPQRHGHRSRGTAPLARMGLVDDKGELATSMLIVDGVKDVRKLLDGGDDDPFALLEQRTEAFGTVGVTHDGADLGKLLDGVPDLSVQNSPVGDDDHRIEERTAGVLQPDQLMDQPRDGVRLAAARRMLDQILGPDSPPGGVSQQLAHHFQLVVAGPYLFSSLASRLVILRLHELGVVLNDVDQSVAGENAIPQVVGFEAVGVRRIPRPVVPPTVERQEPGCLAAKVCAELHFVVVYREMD